MSEALFHAAKEGRVFDMEAAFMSGADVNARDRNGLSPLHWAIECRHWFAVKWLVDHGADVNIRDRVWVTIVANDF